MAELANQADEVDVLIYGARYGDLEDVQTALHEYKVSPDAADEQQRTVNSKTVSQKLQRCTAAALHMASANGHATIVTLLIDKGANVLAENAEGNTPLHWACLNGQEQVIQILMSRGASASAVNLQGRTPIDEALGKPFQDKVFSIINDFSKAETIDEDEDPESQEMEDAAPEDQELRPYNKAAVSE